MFIQAWIQAARLRTLPLAFSSILVGTGLAYDQGKFDAGILGLTLLTTLLYQVLSNYANDYGDGIRGTDAARVGEQRAVASGAISVAQMRKAVFITAGLAFISGTALSVWATREAGLTITLLFIGLGLLAILAAIYYTVGKQAYGYNGLGDLFVLLFFGGLGVLGSFYLQTLRWDPLIILPAGAVGLLATAVLNVNNMRDRLSDLEHGKRTLAARLGHRAAKLYQGILLVGAFDLAFLYNRLRPDGIFQNLYFLSLIPLIYHLYQIFHAEKPQDFEPLLKQMALTTLLFSLLFAIGRVL